MLRFGGHRSPAFLIFLGAALTLSGLAEVLFHTAFTWTLAMFFSMAGFPGAWSGAFRSRWRLGFWRLSVALLVGLASLHVTGARLIALVDGTGYRVAWIQTSAGVALLAVALHTWKRPRRPSTPPIIA